MSFHSLCHVQIVSIDFYDENIWKQNKNKKQRISRVETYTPSFIHLFVEAWRMCVCDSSVSSDRREASDDHQSDAEEHQPIENRAWNTDSASILYLYRTHSNHPENRLRCPTASM